VQPPEIFHRAARRLRRDRIASRFAEADFLRQFMIEGLSERLDAVTREFSDVLDLGCFDAGMPLPGTRIVRADPGFAFARATGGVQCEEDRLPFADGSFDLIVSAGTLDQVNDLPGALSLIRRALRPDGLFLAAFTGGATLATLRATLMEAEGDRPAARVHPQVKLQSAGDLLMRAGFALPVADSETLNVRYAGFGRLIEDLRGMAATSLLVDRSPLSRAAFVEAAGRFAERADTGGRVPEQYEVIYLTGWAPSPDQPKPARRGSATVSLAEALRPKR
jgi:SAM-dependent methyltransferase